jgi:nitroimidazol reductase NimA-like FMN-containing flavoprotein (pyridoxamine 5'-phosphate oxidase superfamily)
MSILASPDPRADTARNIWLATVRADGRPHLVPIWFVEDEGRWYICTAPESVKARNLQGNARVTWSLEDGDNALVLEGTARAVPPPAAVIRKFKEKFDWDITTDKHYGLVFELTPTRKVMG